MNDWHQWMSEDLQLRRLSQRTQEAYLRAVRKLAEHADGPPERLEERDVREYQMFLKNVREFAPGSLRIALRGRDLNYHPHIHYVVPGSGLDEQDSTGRWSFCKESGLPNLRYLDHAVARTAEQGEEDGGGSTIGRVAVHVGGQIDKRAS